MVLAAVTTWGQQRPLESLYRVEITLASPAQIALIYLLYIHPIYYIPLSYCFLKTKARTNTSRLTVDESICVRDRVFMRSSHHPLKSWHVRALAFVRVRTNLSLYYTCLPYKMITDARLIPSIFNK